VDGGVGGEGSLDLPVCVGIVCRRSFVRLIIVIIIYYYQSILSINFINIAQSITAPNDGGAAP